MSNENKVGVEASVETVDNVSTGTGNEQVGSSANASYDDALDKAARDAKKSKWNPKNW